MSALEAELSLIRHCESCGNEYIPRRASRATKYCSVACSAAPKRLYATPEERREATRAASRRTGMNRWREYRDLCVELKVPQRKKNWSSQLTGLRLVKRMPDENRRLWAATSCEYRRYWLERFTLNEIHALARGIDQ